MPDVEKLVGYLRRKLEFVYDTYAGIENGIREDIDRLANSGLSEGDLGRAYHHLEYIGGNLFRQAMLIMICSYLEEAMDLIGEASIPGYPSVSEWVRQFLADN